jgi:hypothetical protein
MSVRAWLAILLVSSAVLFFIGTTIERGTVTSSTPEGAAPSNQPVASQSAEGGSGEAGEIGHSAAPAASSEATGETAPEVSAEWRPLGIDLESPLPVGGAILASLVLALAILRLRSSLVPLAVIGFALVFAVFDVLEIVHQVDVARPSLVAIASTLLAIHVVAILLSIRLLGRRSQDASL